MPCHNTEHMALIDLIYETILDRDLWPGVLTKLADATGAAQVSMTSRDQRNGIYTSLSPRTDPDFLASYDTYWRFHNPLWAQTTAWRVGEIYTLDNLVPRGDFSAMPVFNEWWRRSGRGLEAAGANLLDEGQFSVLAYIANAPGKDNITAQQMCVFKSLLQHVIRSVRITHRLWNLELKNAAPSGQFETLPNSVLLADASAKVVVANAAARRMLDTGSGIIVKNQRLAATGGPDALQKLIASCARNRGADGGAGGDFEIPRPFPLSPLRVSVTPIRSAARLADIPWIGVGAPVAMVTASDPDIDRRRGELYLRHRFGLTAAEAKLAAEFLKGDGRIAAARRRGITVATAKTQLASIFEKTGVHRQAELIRILIDAVDARELELLSRPACGQGQATYITRLVAADHQIYIKTLRNYPHLV